MQPRAVLFDLDDTLIHSFAAWHALLADAIAHFGGAPVSEAAFRASWGQSVAADCESFLPHVTPPELAAFYDANFARRAVLVELIAGARDAITHCRDRGYRVGCVTNSAGVIARAVLDAKGVSPLLDVVLGADEVARAKPEPDLALAAMAALGTDPARTVLVGDSRYDVACARGAGVAAIVVGGGAEGDHAIASLAELGTLLARLHGR